MADPDSEIKGKVQPFEFPQNRCISGAFSRVQRENMDTRMLCICSTSRPVRRDSARGFERPKFANKDPIYKIILCRAYMNGNA